VIPSNIGQSWVYTTVPTQPTKKALRHTTTVGVDHSRYSAPSIAAFGEISPLGERQGCRSFSEGQGWPFRKPSPKARSTGLRRNSGWPFLWILSFGQAKESISAVGPRPDFKTPVVAATQNQSKSLKQKVQRCPNLKPLRFQRHHR